MFFLLLTIVAVIFLMYRLIPIQKQQKSVVRAVSVILLYLIVNAIFLLWLLYRVYLRDYITGQQFCIIIIIHLVLHSIYVIYKFKKKRKPIFQLIMVPLLIGFLYSEWKLWQLDEYTLKVNTYNPAKEIGNTNIHVVSAVSYLVKSVEEVEHEIITHETKLTNFERYPSNKRGLIMIRMGSANSFSNSFEVAESLLTKEMGHNVTLNSQQLFEDNDVTGSSGGLGFYLAGAVENGLVDNEVDIAVTGEITETGNVLSVGYVDVKALNIMLDGIDYFIVPKENKQQALQAVEDKKGSLTVIAVSTIDEAVQAIQKINESL